MRLINHSELLSTSEVGLNSDRNEDQPFSPGLWHKPGLMVTGQGREALVPVGATNRDQRVALVPVRATNRDQWPCTAAWWWEFSPTSLAEREPHLFIRCGAPELSSSSLKQAYGPNLSVHACGAYWAFCGPESWPMDGFLVVFRPWWPSRWHNF